MQRREFIKKASLASGALLANLNHVYPMDQHLTQNQLILATWAPNDKAVQAAYQELLKNGNGFDAIEAGIKIPEADPDDLSVGYGGLPDRDGQVTLDACIMDGNVKCGAVLCLEQIKHPISVARKVMELTPHMYLAGKGALDFATFNGFKKENLLTEKSKLEYEKWLKSEIYDPMETTRKIQDSIKNQHDTIGLLIRNNEGQLFGGCSTSGLAYKMKGRVGDSPIIGAGLYVDNEAGAATATGIGEEIARVCGAHLIVELIRNGHSPKDACKEAVRRIARWNQHKLNEIQVGFIATDIHGRYGAYAMQENFTYVVMDRQGLRIEHADYLVGN
jgi:N4-(beta-N-acetylglucosaminyl)-L-asparaginase